MSTRGVVEREGRPTGGDGRHQHSTEGVGMKSQITHNNNSSNPLEGLEFSALDSPASAGGKETSSLKRQVVNSVHRSSRSSSRPVFTRAKSRSSHWHAVCPALAGQRGGGRRSWLTLSLGRVARAKVPGTLQGLYPAPLLGCGLPT